MGDDNLTSSLTRLWILVDYTGLLPAGRGHLPPRHLPRHPPRPPML